MEMAITPGRILVFNGKDKAGEEPFKPAMLDTALLAVKSKFKSPDLKSYKLSFLAEQAKVPEAEYLKKLTQFCFELTEHRMSGAIKRDELIVQAVDAFDDVTSQLNFLTSRLREWYGITDPEAAKMIADHRKFVNKILENAGPSHFGLKLGDHDMDMIKVFAQSLKQNFQVRDDLEKYIDSIMTELSPNVRALIGPVLGAKLISKAGGLYKLAIMPGSTIQVLGAEKALFRHLIQGKPSPKHGLLYQHPLICSNPRELRGRVARSLSAKLSIAARLDYYGKPLDKELIADFGRRLKELKL